MPENTATPEPTVREAIEIVESSKQSHVKWLEFFAEYPEQRNYQVTMDAAVGDDNHHQLCIARYDRVLQVLRRALNE